MSTESIQQKTIDAADAIDLVHGVVNRNSVYRAFRQGRIKGRKDGHRIIFERASWERWITAARAKHALAEEYRAMRGEQARRVISLVA